MNPFHPEYRQTSYPPNTGRSPTLVNSLHSGVWAVAFGVISYSTASGLGLVDACELGAFYTPSVPLGWR